MRYLTAKDIIIKRRNSFAHKGENGTLLIIGGSESLVGAPILAAQAAFRSGVDIVKVAAPSKVSWAINTFDPSIISYKLLGKSFSEKNVKKCLELATKVDAVLLGSGLGRTLATKKFVRSFLKKIDKTVVIDADALHATFFNDIKSKQVVCTPHAKEFEILKKNNSSIPDYVVLVKKGAVDTITYNKKIRYNKTGVPELAVAGTGDILAGLIAGFVAQKYALLQACYNGVYLVGKAGEEAHKKYGNFSALQVVEQLKIC